MSIGVLCPTRGNVAGAERAFRSMIDTSEAADMIVCVDDDQMDLYAGLPGHARLRIHAGPRTDIVGSVNAAVEAIPHHDAYGLVVDDATFVTPGWDAWVGETLGGFPKRLGVVSASHNAGAFVNFGYVSRDWIDLLGWYACPSTQHFCWDTVLEMLGEATRIEYAPADRFHIHHDMDRNDKTVPVFMMDAVQFLGWCVNQRRDLVQKIRAAMA